MNYASFMKRMGASVIDYAIISIPLLTIVSIIMWYFFNNHISQVFPFIALSLVFFPYFMLVYLIVYPAPSAILTVAITIAVIIFVEALMYTIMEVFNENATIGKRVLKIKITSVRKLKYSIVDKILRNVLKCLSKYLFFVPFLFMLITAQKQTLYDLILGTTVIEKEETR